MKRTRVAALAVLAFSLIAASATALGAQENEREIGCAFAYSPDTNEMVVTVDMPEAPTGTLLALNFERGERPNEDFVFVGRTERTGAATSISVIPVEAVLDGAWTLKARYILADGTKSGRVDCGVFDAGNIGPPALTCTATLIDGTDTVRLTGTLANKPTGSSIVVNLIGDEGYVGLARVSGVAFDTQYDLSDKARGDWTMQARWRVSNDSRGERIDCGSFTLGNDDGSDLLDGPAGVGCWANVNVAVGAAQPSEWTMAITGTVDRRTARINFRGDGSWLYTWQFGQENVSTVRPDTMVVSGAGEAVNGRYPCPADWLSEAASEYLANNAGPGLSNRGVAVRAEFDGALLYTTSRTLAPDFCFKYCAFSNGPFFIDAAGNDVEPVVVSPLPTGSDLVSIGGQYCQGQIVIMNFTYRDDVFEANGIANLGTFRVAGIGNGEQIRVLDVDCEGGTLTWEDVQNGGPAQMFDLTTLG